VLDIDQRELRRGADAVSITPQVFDLLDYLIRNRERVVSKDHPDLNRASSPSCRFSELFVIARNSSFQEKGKPADVHQVASDLGVRYVVSVHNPRRRA